MATLVPATCPCATPTPEHSLERNNWPDRDLPACNRNPACVLVALDPMRVICQFPDNAVDEEEDFPLLLQSTSSMTHAMSGNSRARLWTPKRFRTVLSGMGKRDVPHRRIPVSVPSINRRTIGLLRYKNVART